MNEKKPMQYFSKTKKKWITFKKGDSYKLLSEYKYKIRNRPKVSQMRRSLRKSGDGYKYFRGSTLTPASRTFETKANAKKWLKNNKR